ncbi:MAG TPA: copper resistance protein CopC [Candidatus Dormibacteraeota bacterium]|nr:copper resistance protein CopC [Candidatus Dormibacteraeota bacterium]
MFIAIGFALLPQAAFAHAQLVQTDPAANAQLEYVPPAVTLIFTEPVTAAGAGIRVYSPSGKQVGGPPSTSGSIMSAKLNSTELGTYVVSWQVFASDTHPSRGAFSFTVGRPSANPYSTLLSTAQAGTSTPLGLALQALARWVHFAGFALVFGIAGYRVLTERNDGLGRPVGVGIICLVAAEPLALLGQLASLSFDGDTAIAVLGSSFGRLLALHLGAALLAWTLLAAGRSWPLLAIGGVVALLDGASAHAIPGLPGAGQVLVAIHVSGMGLWVGGLAAYLIAPDIRFRRYAGATLGVAVASGLLLAFAHTPYPAALIATDYGRVLIVKAGLVAAAVLLVVLRRRRLELGVAAAIIAAAAVLAALPPSR